MRIVLVNPMVTIPGWNSYYSGRREGCSLPHGLLSMATVLQENDHDAAVWDLRQYSCMGEVVDLLRMMGTPDAVGVGAMSVDFGVAGEFLTAVKQRIPSAVTVMGGVHATLFPEEVPAAADFVIRGEGEITLLDMADAGFEGFERIQWSQIPKLDELPFIDRGLVDYEGGELRTSFWKGRTPYITMMAGRGCPYKCAFCHPVSQRVFRRTLQRPVEHVVAEMQELAERYDAAYFDFIDDTFTIHMPWVADFCEQYRAADLGIPFVIASRADTVVKQPQLFEWLRDAGCDTVSIGFESGNDRILKLLRKGTTRAINLKAARILRKLGLQIVANIMYGVPTETPQEARDTMSMIREIRPDVCSTAFFTPYPGCDLAEEYAHLSLVTDYADMHRYPNKPKVAGVDYEALLSAGVGA